MKLSPSQNSAPAHQANSPISGPPHPQSGTESSIAIPLKIISFIIVVAFLIFGLASLIPLVVQYSIWFVYVLAIAMAIAMFLAGYCFLEHMQ